jgi:hypothetical protein
MIYELQICLSEMRAAHFRGSACRGHLGHMPGMPAEFCRAATDAGTAGSAPGQHPFGRSIRVVARVAHRNSSSALVDSTLLRSAARASRPSLLRAPDRRAAGSAVAACARIIGRRAHRATRALRSAIHSAAHCRGAGKSQRARPLGSLDRLRPLPWHGARGNRFVIRTLVFGKTARERVNHAERLDLRVFLETFPGVNFPLMRSSIWRSALGPLMPPFLFLERDQSTG